MDRSRRGASSTSHPKRSRASRRSAEASSTSASPGEPLGAGAIRALARRHGIRPTKALGQHFLIDPNLAAAIAGDADLAPDDRLVEVGAGLGSLTRALAAGGNEVLAVEFDRRLLPALEETVGQLPNVAVLHADATDLDWRALTSEGRWVLAANLPYNVGTSIVLEVLARAPAVHRLLVMMQREVAQRLVARPGEDAYGAPSVRVAARATGAIVRPVPPEVFWPRPAVASAVLRLERLGAPDAGVGDPTLWAVVDAGFAQRRKTMRSALRRLGLTPPDAVRVLTEAGLDPDARAESLSLADFRRVADLVTVSGDPSDVA